MHAPAARLVALVLLIGVGTPAALGQGGQRREVLDFRTPVEKLPSAELFGPDLDTVAQTDDRGLRFQLPVQGDTGHVGVDFRPRLRGDFDVELGFEQVAIEGPVPPWGAGVVLRLTFDSPQPLAVLLARMRYPNGPTLTTHRVDTRPDGKLDYQTEHVKAAGDSGRLRLVRAGANLDFWVADGKADPKRIRSLEVGTHDVKALRLYCTRNGRPVGIDVRLTDLAIQADQILDGKAAAPPSAAAPPGPKRGWPIAALIVGLLTLALIALVAWLALRRAPRPAAAALEEFEVDEVDVIEDEAPPAAAPAMISFHCPKCGHSIRARPEHAGQHGKCRQCGAAIVVPPGTADASARVTG
jgi:hypothetical protein